MQFSQTASGGYASLIPVSYEGEILLDPFLVLPKKFTQKDASCVTQLHLAGRHLTAIPPNAFVPFPQLAALWISDNNLRSLANLRGCERLRVLHAARNHLHSLSSAEGCELIDTAHGLEEVDLSGNPLTNLDALLEKLSCLPFLVSLALAGCPAAGEADYRPRTLARLPALTTLDFLPISAHERSAAEHQYGALARGAARTVAVRTTTLLALRSTREAASARLTIRSPAPRTLSSLMLTSRADGLLADAGNETGRSGLGREGLSPQPANITFGAGWGVKTTTRTTLEREAGEVRVRRANSERSGAEAQFRITEADAAPGAMWSSLIDHSEGRRPKSAASPSSFTQSRSGAHAPCSPVRAFTPRTFPRPRSRVPASSPLLTSFAFTASSFVAPPIVTSALINMTQEAGCEELFKRRLRIEMSARGVPQELLKAGSALRAATTGGADRTAALLASLAPALPKLTGTAPLLPEYHREGDTTGGKAPGEEGGGVTMGGLGEGTTLLAASGLLRPSSLGGTLAGSATLCAKYPALTGTLVSAGVRVGAAAAMASSPLALEVAVMAKTGVRLSLQRRPAATLARFGLTAAGGVDPKRASFVDAALNRGAKSGVADAIQADGGPLLPTLMPDGELGAWDKFRLMQIFMKADTDNSGELSIDEIASCLASAAVFGFCLVLNETPAVAGRAGATATAMPLTARRDHISREQTPAGGASTAFLQTDSSRGRAPVLGAARKVTILLERVFAALDGDRNGSISWREFCNAIEGVKPPGAHPDASPPPRIAFRPLSAAECSARSQRHFCMSSIALARLNAIVDAPYPALCADPATPPAEVAAARSAHEAWVREASAIARAASSAAAANGARLMAMAKALSGVYDPAETPPVPPAPRHDFFTLTTLASAHAVAELKEARGAMVRTRRAISMPGDELDDDERAVMRVIHPSFFENEEEDLDEEDGGNLRAQRGELASALVRTLGNQRWQAERLANKAKAPRALHRTTTYI